MFPFIVAIERIHDYNNPNKTATFFLDSQLFVNNFCFFLLVFASLSNTFQLVSNQLDSLFFFKYTDLLSIYLNSLFIYFEAPPLKRGKSPRKASFFC